MPSPGPRGNPLKINRLSLFRLLEALSVFQTVPGAGAQRLDPPGQWAPTWNLTIENERQRFSSGNAGCTREPGESDLNALGVSETRRGLSVAVGRTSFRADPISLFVQPLSRHVTAGRSLWVSIPKSGLTDPDTRLRLRQSIVRGKLRWGRPAFIERL